MSAMLKSVSLELDPSEKEEESYVAEAVIGCREEVWYRDADGDGYGDPENMVEECKQPEGYVSNNLDCDDTEPTEEPCPCPERTLSNGWSADNKNNPLTDEWFERKFPDNLVIGGIEDISRKLTLTSPAAIKEFLPSAGKPDRLNFTCIDPTRKELSNTFAQQLVMLRLNLALNPGLKKAVITRGEYKNRSVQQLFDDANKIISSTEPVSKDYLSALSSICDSVNLSYEDAITGYVVCESEIDPQNKSGKTGDGLQSGSVVIYPNPSSDQFILLNNTSSNVNVVVYSINGVKVGEFVNIKPGETEKFGNEYISGIYMAVVAMDNKIRETYMIIKN
jgi:hypothetical protein